MIDKQLRREISALRQRVIQLETQMARRPIRLPKGPGSLSMSRLVIIDGQTVFNSGGVTYYGINKSGSAISTVGTLYDPDVSTTPGTFTAVTGIGRAFHYIDGVLQTDPVLVVLDTSSPIATLLIDGDPVAAVGTKTLTYTIDTSLSVTAYIPDYL